MHKFGLALTLLFAILGFWDVKGFYDSDMFQNVAVPVMGLIGLVGFMKLALDRT